jgi:hypothetical protein
MTSLGAHPAFSGRHMRPRCTTTIAIGAGLVLLAGAPALHAQARDSVVVVTPGEQYRAGAFKRSILGSGWRELWVTPVTAPVFDLSTYAGGLKLDKRGGGMQTLTLHVTEEEGWREYRFRSANKFITQGMPPVLKHTVLGNLLQDEISALLPAAPVLVPPLLEAIGALHVNPQLYVVGDSPRLGALRDTVVGMVGTVELKGSEAPDKQPGFAGSRAIKGTENFLEDIASSRAHRLDEREFLAVRLVDLLINDPDRTADNFDWARFGEEGAYTWRPLPRDRDWAFMNVGGLWNKFVVRKFYPKLVPFTESYPMKGLLHTTHGLDRRLLQRLSANDFRAISLRVQRAMTDSVIASAVARLPREWREQTLADERITTVLRARRDSLPAAAMEFYRTLAGDVDVFGTKEADRIVVVRHDDGRVTVTVTDPERRSPVIASERRDDGRFVTLSDGSIEPSPFFERTFVPSETNEVRIYADSGDDVAVVRGVPSDAIVVRIIGGKGNDVLADSAGGGDTFLYDAEGNNRFETASGTHVDQRAWKSLTPGFGFKLDDPWKPDWGKKHGWRPVVDYNTGAGLILGFGPTFREYGFRRLPYHWQANASFLVGTGNGRLGAEAELDHRAENSSRSFRVTARVSQLETIRFFGYGNNTANANRAESLVDQTIVALEPSLVWNVGWRQREDEDPMHKDSVPGLRPLAGEFRVGSVLGWIKPEPGAASRLSAANVRGVNDFGLAGATVAVKLDRTDDGAVPTMGWKLDADAAAYPPLFSSSDAFGTASAGGSFYVPLGRAGGPHLAMRAGGDVATGDYPVQFSAGLGGKRSLRGYQFRRFAGDAAVHAGTELRVPVGTVNFIIRSQVGVFGLVDAGRVWFDGSSNGGWHSGVGGGLWFSAFGRSVSVAYARGDANRLYFKSGLSY